MSRFTVNKRLGGNGKLDYPIGMITADEIRLSGEMYYTWDAVINLFGSSYFTLSPYANSYSIYAINGAPGYLEGAVSNRIVPSVALKSNVTISDGNGTQANPFVVE